MGSLRTWNCLSEFYTFSLFFLQYHLLSHTRMIPSISSPITRQHYQTVLRLTPYQSSLIKNPHNLRITTKVNGKTMQDGKTDDMIFNVAKTISFLSQGTTLLPGDIIFTGTPSGVGMGRTPQLWMKDGDVIEIELEGVGKIVNKVEYSKPKAKL